MLGVFPDGENAWLVIASNGGAPDSPALVHQHRQEPGQVWLHVGNRKRLRVNVESLQGEAREKAYAARRGGRQELRRLSRTRPTARSRSSA